jgi:hypothetical protein
MDRVAEENRGGGGGGGGGGGVLCAIMKLETRDRVQGGGGERLIKDRVNQRTCVL